MKNSSEKKKSKTRSSRMKAIGNGNDVSYGVHLVGGLSFARTIFDAVRIDAGIKNGLILTYVELPGVEGRGQRWYFLSRWTGNGPIGAQLDGRNGFASDSRFFMYREDGKAWNTFQLCDLVSFFQEENNFNPPFTKREIDDWFKNHGFIFGYEISGTC